MNYKAPDGHIIESKAYPEEVVYTSVCSDIVDGIYYSEETTGSSTPPGIKQIRITRVVNNNSMQITVRESSSQELIDYIESVKNEII